MAGDGDVAIGMTCAESEINDGDASLAVARRRAINIIVVGPARGCSPTQDDAVVRHRAGEITRDCRRRRRCRRRRCQRLLCLGLPAWQERCDEGGEERQEQKRYHTVRGPWLHDQSSRAMGSGKACSPCLFCSERMRRIACLQPDGRHLHAAQPARIHRDAKPSALTDRNALPCNIDNASAEHLCNSVVYLLGMSLFMPSPIFFIPILCQFGSGRWQGCPAGPFLPRISSPIQPVTKRLDLAGRGRRVLVPSGANLLAAIPRAERLRSRQWLSERPSKAVPASESKGRKSGAGWSC